MLKIILCDDQINELDNVSKLLAEYSANFSSIHVKTFSSSQKLSQDINALQSADIFLLDIVMPNISGIELGKLIRSYNDEAKIVYLTTSTDFALDAYGVEAMQYLLKPVSKETLFSVMSKAIRLVKKKDKYFSIETRSETIPVKINDIKYVEYKDHVLYFCINDEIIRSKFFRLSFSSVIQELFDHEDFILTHRAYLVNMRHVKKMYPQTLELDNLYQIPISNNRKNQVRSAYMIFLIKG